MGRLDGKVALITGGARGQGRNHAVTLAKEGAQIITCDIARQLDSVEYPMATEEDLEETVRLVEDLDQRCVAMVADCNDGKAMEDLVAKGLSEFGRIDIVAANHGIATQGMYDTTEAAWREMFDVNVTGVFLACRAALPSMIERGEGGSIVITASVAGLKPFYQAFAYSTAKHAAVGLMKNLSAELAPHSIRVNAICPTMVDTPMIDNQMMHTLFAGGAEGATKEDMVMPSRAMNCMPVPWVEMQDISNALLWLVSEDARFVTGVALPIDAGFANQPSGIPLEVGEMLAEMGG